MTTDVVGDPFGAAGLRRAVLDAWRASPDRFREDANAEEDAALGAYRDRVVVELAQNAADAAARADGRSRGAGRLLVRLERDDDGARLVVANTGAPLDAAGVRALASLRASAKRGGAAGGVGRFGVGAAAVLSVGDDATWATRTAAGIRGVRFSAAATREAVAALGSADLDGEVAARGGAVPVLRLPFPAADEQVLAALPDGYDTAVVVLLRDDAAAAAVARALAAVDDALLLALPALAEVRVEVPSGGDGPRVLAGVAERWHLLRRSGPLPPDALAGLGVEERARAGRTGWSLTWALPRHRPTAPAAVDLFALDLLDGSPPGPDPGWAGGPPGGVLHAPTPTDEPLSLPALLVADLPLDAGRRRVPDSPAARAVLAAAGAAYAELLAERAAAGDDVLPLVPVGLGAGWVDDAVRAAATDALRGAAVLLPVAPEGAAPGEPLRPDRALALDDGPLADDPRALRALAPLVAGLVAAPRSARAALAVLEVRRVGLGEVAEALPDDPARWVAAAAALAPAAVDPAAREQLAALRVPLAGGRSAVGARGLLLPSADPALAGAVAALAGCGLRLVEPRVTADPGAEHLLAALGARPAGARELLADVAVLAAVRGLAEDDDGARWVDGGEVAPLAAAVLDLAVVATAAGDLAPGDLPELAGLPLPSDEGEVLPAAGLVLPGSPAAALLDPDEVAPAHPHLVERWGAGALTAVGVAHSLALVRWEDVDLLAPPEELLDLAGADDWLDVAVRTAGRAASAAAVVAVRDLDLVRPGAEAELAAHLSADPALRAALVEPVRLVRPDGSWVAVRSPSAAWLADELGLAGRASPAAGAPVRAVLPLAPAWAETLDPALGAALGLVAHLGELDADGWQRVLDDAGAGADGSGGVRAAGVPAALAGPLGAADLLPLWRELGRALLADASATGLGAARLPPSHVLALDASDRVVRVPAEEAVVVDDPCWAQRTDLGARVVGGSAAAAALAGALQMSLASEVAPGRVGGVGEDVEVAAGVLSLLPGCPVTWSHRADLRVDGAAVGWWVEGRGPSARVHATGPAAAARGLALAAGRWDARAAVEAVLADPAGAARALVEDAAGSPS